MRDDLSILVTVDTEGDDEWSFHRHPANDNIEYVPGFDRALERVGARATYLVTWGVATDRRAVDVLGELHDRGRCEIGAHCHAWNTPPIDGPDGAQPFLNELGPEAQRAKIEALTDAVEASFGARPTSFRGGRFGAGTDTVAILEALGYRVESSVTPGISWRTTPGLPGGPGGPDWSDAPIGPYRIDAGHLAEPGDGPLLEIPVTVVRSRRLGRPLERWIAGFGPAGVVSRLVYRAGLGHVVWFRPSSHTVDEIVRAADVAIARGATALNMMLHSSELMPGGSPYARTKDDTAALLGRTEEALEKVIARTGAVPRTLEETRRTIVRAGRTAGAGTPGDDGSLDEPERGRVAC